MAIPLLTHPNPSGARATGAAVGDLKALPWNSFHPVRIVPQAWLRSMKEPLVPAGSYERAVAAGNLTGGSEARQEEAIRVLLALPPPNR